MIAGIEDPRKQTGTLKLLLRIIEDSNIKLVADEMVVEEVLRYAELLQSQTATTIVIALIRRTTIVKVSENFRKICKTYIQTPDKADILHAAACLQTGATMITNERPTLRQNTETANHTGLDNHRSHRGPAIVELEHFFQATGSLFN